MPTVETTLLPPEGTDFVELTSWTGDADFPSTPVAEDQLVGADTLTLNADGTVDGADGAYTLTLIRQNGSAESVAYQIGDAPALPEDVTITTTLQAPNGWNWAELEEGFSDFMFDHLPAADQPVAGEQILIEDVNGSVSPGGTFVLEVESAEIPCVLIKLNGDAVGFYIDSADLEEHDAEEIEKYAPGYVQFRPHIKEKPSIATVTWWSAGNHPKVQRRVRMFNRNS